MSFEPPFSDAGAEPFVRAVLTAFEEKGPDAISWASPDEELPPFALFNNSRRINQKHPAVWCAPRQEETPIGGSGNLLETVLTLEVGVEVVFKPDDDGNAIGYRLMRYARAVRQTVLSMTVAEWSEGLPEGKWGALNVEVTPTRYDDFFNERQSVYKKTALMVVKVSLLEG